MTQEWLAVGGPIHGQWRPAVGDFLAVPEPDSTVTYSSVFGRRVVAVPAPPVLYRPTQLSLPGWRVKLPVWCEDRLARGRLAPMFASVLPGGLHGVPRDASWACRWCYGRPMHGHDTCRRVACISHWAAVQSLETMTWRGEER